MLADHQEWLTNGQYFLKSSAHYFQEPHSGVLWPNFALPRFIYSYHIKSQRRHLPFHFLLIFFNIHLTLYGNSTIVISQTPEGRHLVVCGSQDINSAPGQTTWSVQHPFNSRIGFAFTRRLLGRSHASTWARMLLLTCQNAKTLIKVRDGTDGKRT